MNGWAVAFWIAVLVATGAFVVVGAEDRKRRDHFHRTRFLERWIQEHFEGSLDSPYETERRRTP